MAQPEDVGDFHKAAAAVVCTNAVYHQCGGIGYVKDIFA